MIRVLLTDVSEHYGHSEDGRELLAKCGGRIRDAYLFDDNMGVHLCSLTPSYELYFLESVPESFPDDDAERDRVQSDLWHANRETPHVDYMQRINLAETIPVEQFNDCPADDDPEYSDADDAYSERINDAIEYVQGNPPY